MVLRGVGEEDGMEGRCVESWCLMPWECMAICAQQNVCFYACACACAFAF